MLHTIGGDCSKDLGGAVSFSILSGLATLPSLPRQFVLLDHEDSCAQGVTRTREVRRTRSPEGQLITTHSTTFQADRGQSHNMLRGTTSYVQKHHLRSKSVLLSRMCYFLKKRQDVAIRE